VKKPHERPSIGVLLCATKDDEVVEYALRENGPRRRRDQSVTATSRNWSTSACSLGSSPCASRRTTRPPSSAPPLAASAAQRVPTAPKARFVGRQELTRAERWALIALDGLVAVLASWRQHLQSDEMEREER